MLSLISKRHFINSCVSYSFFLFIFDGGLVNISIITMIIIMRAHRRTSNFTTKIEILIVERSYVERSYPIPYCPNHFRHMQLISREPLINGNVCCYFVVKYFDLNSVICIGSK